MAQKNITQMRKEVADNLYDDTTNNWKTRSALVDYYVATKTDEEIRQMWIDAGLGGDNEDEED